MRIGYLGNLGSPFSTENDRKLALESLGHTVIPFQENTTTAKQLLASLTRLDLLLYSHTHSWEVPGLIEVFRQYKKAGVPTASVHADLWRGLERWKDVGTEATWFAEYVFTPDDSKDWPHGINHYYLRPGVSVADCYSARPDRYRFPHDIVFIGSKSYHKEYQWRPQLIDWLQATYKYNFRLYGNDGVEVVRGRKLNKLCSSARVVVGDSCLSGEIPGYYSDRVPYLTGRGAFLLHTQNQYISNPGVVQFPKDFAALKEIIDYYLHHESERQAMRQSGFDYTKTHDTYTIISQEMLHTIFG